MATYDCDDFRVSFEHVDGTAYSVISRAADGREIRSTFSLPMATDVLENAVLHGNRQDESLMVELGFANLGPTLVITVRDQGAGFDPASVPDPTDAQNLLKASGRGILFMRSFMDDVAWERHPHGGTVVRMTKKR